MERSIAVGFIGCGLVSELHQLALAGSEVGRLIGVFDVDGARAAQRADAWNVRAYDSLERMLDDDAIEAVFVLSPLEKHKEQVLLAVQHGKHVLVEKPAAGSAADILEMAEAATRHGRVVMPAHNYVYHPDVWRARRLIRQGDLGCICATWIHYAIDHPEEIAARYPGILRQVLTHHLYLILYLLGRPRQVWAMRQSLRDGPRERDDQASIVLQMEDGSSAHLFATFAADDPTSDPWTFLVKVLGTRGGITYSWRDAVFQRPLGTLPMALVPYEESYGYEVDHFLRRCVMRGESPLSTMLDAARTEHLVELAERSAVCGTQVAVDDGDALWPDKN